MVACGHGATCRKVCWRSRPARILVRSTRAASQAGPASPAARPHHWMFFFSLRMTLMAMSTFNASYTRRRMFFSSNATPVGDPACSKFPSGFLPFDAPHMRRQTCEQEVTRMQ